MFTGEYHYKIDDKGRVSFPPKFREELKAGLVLARGYEECLIVYTMDEWKKLSEKQAALPVGRSQVRRMNRWMFATSFEMDFDGQGRVALPAPLREYAGILNEVVIVGVNSCLEIWSKQRWEEECAEMAGQVLQISESLEDHR